MIHVTDIISYQKCPRRWSFESRLVWGKDPGSYRPYTLGTAVHDGIERLFPVGGKVSREDANIFIENVVDEHFPPQELVISDVLTDPLEEDRQLCRGMLKGYYDWRNSLVGPYSDKLLETVATEFGFSVVFGDVVLSGRADAVVRSEDGRYYVMEYKTAGSILERSKYIQFELQPTFYALAVGMQMGVHINGVIYHLLRKKLPTVPEVLKGGGLTRRKNIDTTVSKYIETARSVHTEWSTERIRERYSEVLEALELKGNTFFSLNYIPKFPNELNAAKPKIHSLAETMVSLAENKEKHPEKFVENGGPHCRQCPFRSPCLLALEGDYEGMMDELDEMPDREPLREHVEETEEIE